MIGLPPVRWHARYHDVVVKRSVRAILVADGGELLLIKHESGPAATRAEQGVAVIVANLVKIPLSR
jgi:hypothetical protein